VPRKVHCSPDRAQPVYDIHSIPLKSLEGGPTPCTGLTYVQHAATGCLHPWTHPNPTRLYAHRLVPWAHPNPTHLHAHSPLPVPGPQDHTSGCQQCRLWPPPPAQRPACAKSKWRRGGQGGLPPSQGGGAGQIRNRPTCPTHSMIAGKAPGQPCTALPPVPPGAGKWTGQASSTCVSRLTQAKNSASSSASRSLAGLPPSCLWPGGRGVGVVAGQDGGRFISWQG